MKKLYLLIIVFASSYSFAQTIVQSDLPFAGLGWTSGVDSTYSAAIPPGGTGQNWNYSTLQYDYVDTSGFADATGTPFASFYPSANLAAHKLSTDEWTYFTNSSTGFYVNGFVSNSTPFVISPPQMYLPVPFSYGNSQVNISRVQIDTVYMTYNARILINFHAAFDADGSGSLIAPTATYPSTLRVKETLLETDSFLVDLLNNGNYMFFGSQQSQTTYYRWYTHGGTANYILGITADSLGTTGTQSDYIMQWAMLGTNDLKSSTLQIYPDPANSYITIADGNAPIQSVEIYNLVGEKILTSANNSAMRSEMKLDVSDWKPGIYFYSIQSGGNKIQGKFSVQH